MRRPTFLRVYSSDATEKDDEATPINRSDSDDVRNSIDNNELHLYTELHNDEQMLMFRPTMALEGPVARSYFDGTWPWQCVVGASTRREAGAHRGPRLPGLGRRP